MLCMESAWSRTLLSKNGGLNVPKGLMCGLECCCACCVVVLYPNNAASADSAVARGGSKVSGDPSKGSTKLCGLGSALCRSHVSQF